MQRPAMAGRRARHLLGPACHGTRGEWKPCGWLTARQLNLSPPGQRVRLERTPGPGRVPGPGPGTRTRMLTGPSRVLPVPEGDHGRGAMVVVMLRGSQRLACPRGRCDGQPAGAVMDPAGLARGQAPGRPRRGRRVSAPASARRDRSRRNRHGCHSSQGMLTPIEDELRASQAQPRSMTRIRQPGSGQPGAHQSGKPGKLQGLRRVRAHPAVIWLTWRRAASGPSRLPVVRCGARQPL